MKTIEIPVFTRLQDNGDGGYTTYVYNNNEELLADHPKAKDFVEKENGKWEDITIELTDEQKSAILNSEDEDENGYIGKGTIKLNIDNDGTITLAEPLYFRAGQ